MALIKCPECQKEISDKSQHCMHCGYPINSQKVIIENINGIDYDVSFLLHDETTQVAKIKKVLEITGCDAFKAKEIVLKYHPTPQPKQKSINQITCPYCNSTDLFKITATKKAFKIGLFGLFGAIDDAGKTWRCNSCGSKW